MLLIHQLIGERENSYEYILLTLQKRSNSNRFTSYICSNSNGVGYKLFDHDKEVAYSIKVIFPVFVIVSCI